MLTKKRLGKEPPAEGSSQVTEEQALTTAQTTIQTTHIPQTLHLQPSTNLHRTTTYPIEQPRTQTEVLGLDTSTANTTLLPSHQHQHQHQTIEMEEDLQQDSEEEIKAVIKDKLALLY
jgi:hypothetical protein